MARFLILHGPNLNLLGTREPDVYGRDSLADIDSRLAGLALNEGHELQTFQSNSEGALIDRVQQANTEAVAGIVINPGAFTHTSIALRDAFLSVAIPFIEVHLSNVHAREEFRQCSYLSDIAQGVISGLGARGYEAALAAIMATFDSSSGSSSAGS